MFVQIFELKIFSIAFAEKIYRVQPMGIWDLNVSNSVKHCHFNGSLAIEIHKESAQFFQSFLNKHSDKGEQMPVSKALWQS